MELEKLIRRTQVIRYMWDNTNPKYNLWNVSYLNDLEDQKHEIKIINGCETYGYNLDVGVYCYHLVRNRLKLIGVITKDGIRRL